MPNRSRGREDPNLPEIRYAAFEGAPHHSRGLSPHRQAGWSRDWGGGSTEVG